jgi:hypothetical protein
MKVAFNSERQTKVPQVCAEYSTLRLRSSIKIFTCTVEAEQGLLALNGALAFGHLHVQNSH